MALCPLDAWDMGFNPQVLGIGGTIAIKSNKKKIEMDFKNLQQNEISIILRMKTTIRLKISILFLSFLSNPFLITGQSLVQLYRMGGSVAEKPIKNLSQKS